MTDEERVKELEKTIERYRATIYELRKEFDGKIKAILKRISDRKAEEIKRTI